MPSTAPTTTEPRFDLAALEFEAVRDLLLLRLTTPIGRPAVERLQPSSDVAAVASRLRQAAELAERRRRDDPTPLSGVVEVRSWLSPFFAGEHAPETRDLADLKRLLRVTDRCRRWLREDPEAGSLVELGGCFPDVLDLAEELEGIVDDRGEVLSSASIKLAEIRRGIDAAETGVRRAVQAFLADEAVRRCLQTPEPSWRHGRPVFQVRQEHRHRIAGVLHDRSQSGATLFVEPSAIVEAANRLSDARADEHREVQVIVARVCRGLRRCRAAIEASVEALTELDLRTACARLIIEDGYCAPEVSPDGPLRICGGRHPMLLQQAGAAIVPLDVSLGDPHHLLVVTGPNTGGKTVVLKTIGLLSLMAACSLPVPALAGTRLPLFDGVFADIGDEQAIAQNLSTFSSHVRRIARCLTRATRRSLVLVDELGAGTDPEEGGALGHAVLELLERNGVAAVVTTHLGRLKDFAYQHRGAENGSMAFDGTTLRPLYRLEIGVPGCSHALDIAGQVGMPAELVARARSLIAHRDRSMEEVVQKVQETRRQAEQDRRRTVALTREAEANERRLSEQLQEVERREMWLEEEADAVVDEQMRAVRALVEAACKKLQNAPKPFGDDARELAGELAGLLRRSSVHRRRMRFVGELRRDSPVFVPRLGRRCVVKKIDRAREVCTVEYGKIRVEVPFEDLSWLQPL